MNVLFQSIEGAIGGNAYQHNKVNQWTSNVVEQCLNQLTKLGKPFKYIGKKNEETTLKVKKKEPQTIKQTCTATVCNCCVSTVQLQVARSSFLWVLFSNTTLFVISELLVTGSWVKEDYALPEEIAPLWQQLEFSCPHYSENEFPWELPRS